MILSAFEVFLLVSIRYMKWARYRIEIHGLSCSCHHSEKYHLDWFFNVNILGNVSKYNLNLGQR